MPRCTSYRVFEPAQRITERLSRRANSKSTGEAGIVTHLFYSMPTHTSRTEENS
jgi:hypothetical protein